MKKLFVRVLAGAILTLALVGCDNPGFSYSVYIYRSTGGMETKLYIPKGYELTSNVDYILDGTNAVVRLVFFNRNKIPQREQNYKGE